MLGIYRLSMFFCWKPTFSNRKRIYIHGELSFLAGFKEPGATTALQAAAAPSLLARVLMVAVGLTAMLYSELKLVAKPNKNVSGDFRREVWVSSSEMWIYKLEWWLSVLVDGGDARA